MKALRQAAQDYIRMRRHLGFKMRHEERRLRRFVFFMEECDASYITTKLALRRATEPTDAQPSTWAERLMCVRVFARYCIGADPRTEVPPLSLLPHRPKRATPYLYSEEEIRELMDAAQLLPPSGGLRGLTYRCLFGLLTVTGLRISEALALTRDDVDLQNGLLTIRGAKFGKSRLVPLHASACRALARYARQRDAFLHPPYAANFLLCARGRPPQRSPRSTVSFINSHVILGCGVRRIVAGLACKTSVTAARRRSYSSGIKLVKTSNAACQCSPRSWAMSMSATHTGTCQGRRNFWSRRPCDWKSAGRCGHEIDTHPAGLA